ncbi:pyrroloquinoline quinone biosynthesis peptide chaperone PqqD [Paenalcaligenes niemegkensis]|uniref:pyrroloquinoline quinone biosynthesis peptide chaperone PqqD n=1 Tax=Paenalcaligenes niemegkensis TaxID=2895469 RepID=UPI001EE860D5|nr:pyrroloquinoline quinone biosynthesis peptide chaperone PqqD [Paenalcaligenes niemegkensis]MCQ9615838.1 pyrroloquinoline quinone biosynthesis peptide chaperone PqqD [Paenalcaligenes niemegkensis]
MSTLALDSRPALKPLFRMQWEAAQNAYVLLYPEGMVRLNDSAAEILKHCTGTSSVLQMCTELEQQFGVDEIQEDVLQFLNHAIERGWLHI